MFKKSKPPAFVPIAPPPSAPEIMDVIDEITGQQAIIAAGPDGKKHRVIKQLPRTPQQQAFFQQGEELMARAIKNIQQLQPFDPNSVVDYAPVVQAFANLNQEQARDLGKIADFGNIQQDIDNFKQMQTTLLEDQFRNNRNNLETDLARKGKSQGSYGQEQRARNSYYENLLRQQNEVNATQYGENLADQRLGRNLTAYEARQQGRENQLNAAQGEYNLKQQQAQDLDYRRQVGIGENMNQFGLGQNLTGQDLARAMGGRAAELGNQMFAQQSADQANRYNADINRQQINYGNQMAQYNNKPIGFRDFAGNLIGQGLGMALGGAIGGPMGAAAGGMAANKFMNK